MRRTLLGSCHALGSLRRDSDPLMQQPLLTTKIRPRPLCLGAIAVLLAIGWLWPSEKGATSWTAVLAALLPFMLAQCLRGLRLFLLIYDRRMRFGEVFSAHFMTIPLTHLLPFKLGELLRIGILGCLLQNPSRAILAVWTERIYDIVAVLLILAVLTISGGQGLTAHASFIILAGSFLFISFSLFFVIPENLSMLKRYLLTRDDDPRSLTKLHYVDRLHGILRHAADVWSAHWATVTWLSAAIWLLELTWLWILLDHFGHGELADFAISFAAVALNDLSQLGSQGPETAWLGEQLLPAAGRLTNGLILVIGLLIAVASLVISRRRRLKESHLA